MELKLHDRIYDEGDRANFPSSGTVVEILEATAYSPESVRIIYDDERFEDDKKESVVPVICFERGPGRGLWLESEFYEKKQNELKLFLAKYKNKGE